MAVWLRKIQKKNPQDLTQSKWYLTQEKSGNVGIKDMAKEIEGRSALSLGDVQSVLSNVMYWVKNSNGYFEVLDGQQRTISIYEYVNGRFSIKYKQFSTLAANEQEQILNYSLMVYFCEGTDSEKLKWFKTVNRAGGGFNRTETNDPPPRKAIMSNGVGKTSWRFNR
jgi:hypothetical protein